MTRPLNRNDQGPVPPGMRPSTVWEALAACRGHPLALFYPEQGESPRAGKRICAGCPVRAPCLVAGMPERSGIWGGLTRNERSALRRKARQAKAA